MSSQLIQLFVVNIKGFLREPGIIFWSILFPILMAWGLGMAFSKKGELLRTIAFVQEDPRISDQWKAFISDSQSSEETSWYKKIGNKEFGFTTYRFIPVTWDDAVLMLKRGKTGLIIRQSSDSMEYHFDPINPEAQLSYLQLSAALNGKNLNQSDVAIKPITQVGTRYVDFLVPGLMAMGIMMSCMWGISYSNIDKRIKKLMRRMVATPMKKYNYLIAQFVSRLWLSALESFLLILFAYLYFGTTIQGSILALFLLFIAGNIAFTGIATLVSARTDNTQVANGLINLVVMPMMILSGIFFSYHNFPDFMVVVIQQFPLTMLADETRNIFIEGAGFFDVMPKILILTALGLVFYIAGLRVFKWY